MEWLVGAVLSTSAWVGKGGQGVCGVGPGPLGSELPGGLLPGVVGELRTCLMDLLQLMFVRCRFVG